MNKTFVLHSSHCLPPKVQISLGVTDEVKSSKHFLGKCMNCKQSLQPDRGLAGASKTCYLSHDQLQSIVYLYLQTFTASYFQNNSSVQYQSELCNIQGFFGTCLERSKKYLSELDDFFLLSQKSFRPQLNHFCTKLNHFFELSSNF